MKKLVGSLIFASVLVTSMFAATLTGKVTQLYMKPNGDVLIKIDTRNFRTIANANAHVKDFLAMALTAQASNKDLQIFFNDNDVIDSMLIK